MLIANPEHWRSQGRGIVVDHRTRLREHGWFLRYLSSQRAMFRLRIWICCLLQTSWRSLRRHSGMRNSLVIRFPEDTACTPVKTQSYQRIESGLTILLDRKQICNGRRNYIVSVIRLVPGNVATWIWKLGNAASTHLLHFDQLISHQRQSWKDFIKWLARKTG